MPTTKRQVIRSYDRATMVSRISALRKMGMSFEEAKAHFDAEEKAGHELPLPTSLAAAERQRREDARVAQVVEALNGPSWISDGTKAKLLAILSDVAVNADVADGVAK